MYPAPQVSVEYIPKTLELVPLLTHFPQRNHHAEFSDNPFRTFLYGFLPLCIFLKNTA